MLTRNFYNLIGTMLQSSTIACGTLPATDVYGMQCFLTGQYAQFPYARTAGYTSDRNAAGITLGSGSTAPDERDYQLDEPISSGINVALTATNVVVNDGEPYLRYRLTVTNNSSSDKVLAEIGYKQAVQGTRFAGDNSVSNYNVLIDRTLIEPAITLPPAEACVIEYRLMTDSQERTVEGVRIVSWQYGSDEDVAAMIAAAHAGTIDLRECGWQVGDMRAVEIGAFTAGGNVSVPAQTLDLAISSFDDYEGCGCVMQADFAEALSVAVRMHGSNTNEGGYGASEMFATTLPAMEAALPEWLSSALVEFDARTGEGSNSATIVSVAGNRLALRSEVETRGTNGYSKAGEGVPLPWYQTADKMRQRRRGRAGSNNTYLLRSPANNTTGYAYQSGSSSLGYNTMNASSTAGLAPFLCL